MGSRGEWDLAYRTAAQRIMDAPDCWRAHRAMAHVFHVRHQNEFAIRHQKQALRLYQEQTANNQTVAPLWCELAMAELRAGELDAAKAHFERALQSDVEHLPSRRGLKETEVKITAIGTRENNGHPLLNEGQALERVGDYAGAWSLYVRAKAQLAEQGFRYNREAVETRFAQLRSHCSRTRMLRLYSVLQPESRDSFTPVFILGYPRSGTTLLEQCLSQGDHVIAGDELPFLTEIVNQASRFFGSQLAYPFCLDELAIADTTIVIQHLRAHYRARVIERLGRDPGPGFFVTDKMPLNEIYLPLIWLLFPDAPCILIERNPLDVIVSNFALFLTHGSHQACDPISCHHHIAAVRALVEHYRSKLFEIKLLKVDYRDLVQDPGNSLLNITQFAGMDFDGAMLHPEHGTRFCRTASWAQVREPIGTKGLDRWRRFETQLRAALGNEIVDRYR